MSCLWDIKENGRLPSILMSKLLLDGESFLFGLHESKRKQIKFVENVSRLDYVYGNTIQYVAYELLFQRKCVTDDKFYACIIIVP